MSHNVAMDTVRSMSRDLVKIEAQRQRIEELEKGRDAAIELLSSLQKPQQRGVSDYQRFCQHYAIITQVIALLQGGVDDEA